MVLRCAAVVFVFCVLANHSFIRCCWRELFRHSPAVMIWGVGNSMCNPGLAAFAADIAEDEQTRGQVRARILSYLCRYIYPSICLPNYLTTCLPNDRSVHLTNLRLSALSTAGSVPLANGRRCRFLTRPRWPRSPCTVNGLHHSPVVRRCRGHSGKRNVCAAHYRS